MATKEQNNKKKLIKVTNAHLIFSFIATTFLLIILISVSTGLSKKYILDRLKTENELKLKNYSTKIQEKISHNVLIVKNLITITEEYKKIPENQRRDYFNNLIINVLNTNTHIYNIFLILKPYTIDNLDQIYQDTYQGFSGQFAIKYTRGKEINKNTITSEDIALLTTYEKKFILKRSNILIISPLISHQVISEKQIFTRIVGAIKDNKSNIIGIIGIDIPNTFIINSLPSEELNNLFLLNQEFKFIYHPEKQYISQNVKSVIPNFLQSDTYTTLLNNKTFFSKTKYPNKGFLLAYPIKIYKNNLWTIIKFIPQNALKPYKAAYFNVRRVVSIAILIYMLSYIFITIILLKRYNNIIKNFIESTLTNRPIDIADFQKKGIFSRLKELNDLIIGVKKIQETYNQRIKFIEELNKGNYDIDNLIPISKDDIISYVLNELKENLKKTYQIQQEHIKHQEIETWKNLGLAKFNEILRSNINNPEKLAYETISELTDYLNAQVGAFFVLTQKEGKEVLELLGYYGYNRKIYEKKFFELGEGLTGNVALEKIPTVSKVPPDYVELATGLGKIAPNYIAVYPLITLDVLYGIIEIAKIDEFQDYEQDFLKNISEIIASSLATVKINQETKNLLEQSQKSASQMRQKEKELEETIKELEKIQKESQEQRFRLESIISALNEIVYYAEFSASKKVIMVNKQITDRFNIPYTQATEKTYFELFKIPILEIDTHQKYWDKVLNGYKVEFPLEVDISETETIWINASLIPIIKDLKVDKVIFIGVDITPVKEKEKELDKLIIEVKEKEERLKIQEMEMDMTLNELTKLEKALEEKDKTIEELENKLEQIQNKYEKMIKEFEKRLNRSKKIEIALREKIDALQKQIAELKNKKD